MRHLLAIPAALAILAAPAHAQTMKALMYGTNGNVIAPNIAFTNQVSVLGVNIASGGMVQYNGNDIYDMSANSFVGAVNFDDPASTRANLGFSTNLNTFWTATNASNARSALGISNSAISGLNSNVVHVLGLDSNQNLILPTNYSEFVTFPANSGIALPTIEITSGGGVENLIYSGGVGEEEGAGLYFGKAAALNTRKSLGWEFVLRTNSTSRASTTNLADDETLKYAFPSSGNYFVALSHLMVVDTNTGLKVRMVGTNATVRGTWSFGAVQATNEHSVSLSGVSGTRMFHQWFVVDASTNASIVFQWAQQTSGTNPTQILPGSFLRIERMD